jgi:hemerythrin-like domain-containing protein
MSPTENLKREHEAIYEVLNIMSKIANDIKEKKVFYTTDIDSIVDFLIVFWYNCHNQKEEQVFYPALVRAGIQTDDESIGDISHEHSMGRIYIREMSYSIENCKIGNSFSCERLVDSLNNYVNLLRFHIQKEEEVLFPMADVVFTEENLREISNQFEEIEEQTIGHSVHEQYFELLKQLKGQYTNIIPSVYKMEYTKELFYAS